MIDHLLKQVSFFENLSDKKIIIFGTGHAGKALKAILDYLHVTIAYFIDNDKSKWGTSIDGVMINNPDELKKENQNELAIFVASMYFKEISKQLTEMHFQEYAHYWNINNLDIEKRKAFFVDDIQERDQLLREEVYSALETGVDWEEAVRNPRAASHGERVLEYAYVAAWFKKNQPDKILDVGCVLNNSIINDYLPQHADISFLNPALEQLVRSNVTYYVKKLQQFTTTEKYDLVTCLSTIEHFGFDNTRYGFPDVDLGWDWDRCIEEVVESSKRLVELASQQGTVIISFPYGKKEFVRLPPMTGVRISQVVHSDHVKLLKEAFTDQKICMRFFKLDRTGWIRASEKDEFAGYGEIGPGASGVLIIEIKKH